MNLEKINWSSWLFCQACCGWVANRERRIRVRGRHERQVRNPSGLDFRLGCFARVAGGLGVGGYREEDSWFAGYEWRYLVCRACAAHIGWEYRGTIHGSEGLQQDRFQALIMARVGELAELSLN